MRYIQSSDFGTTAHGRATKLYVLENRQGLQAVITNYGAILVSLQVPDRRGNTADVVLGYDTLVGYEQDRFFFGGTIGRYANRLACGRFALDGAGYQASINDGPNSLHGGTVGFHKRIWAAADRSTLSTQILELSYVSPDGEEGFPGELSVKVCYALPVDASDLHITYSATTNRPTVVNLTNHSYFNLSGDMARDILDHQLTIHAQHYTPVNSTLIPTGEVVAVTDTPFDFQSPAAIGERIRQADEQLRLGNGYDHNWVLRKSGGNHSQSAATLYDPESGLVLEVLTTEPGLQFYSGNFLNGSVRGKRGTAYAYRTGLCLETQHFPDSPNHTSFPDTTLRPGQEFASETILRFSTKK
jgi:aldose 1-epimerase